MSNLVWFTEESATDSALTGGKGANLAKLAAAGFDVPSGFVVTTQAYASFAAPLNASISELLASVDYGDADGVDRIAEQIRGLITEGELPADLLGELESAYAKLGSDVLVAVRSSGTAEDLAGTSFAGLHDTFLEVRGIDEVARTVRACWASMWTARATAYRQRQGFVHSEAQIAVVVQTMVDAEVAGVLFTGNPLNTATDEFVLNATYGLGEAVVSGIMNPDQFVVAATDLRVKRRELGAKELRIIRDQAQGRGTVTEEVPVEDRERYCLTDDKVADIAGLGRRVMAYYDDIPQDIEWALTDGQVHLLQSRPVTGVEFSWDADVNAQALVDIDQWGDLELDDDTIWTRAAADEWWTGPTSPLFFSMRMQAMARPESNANRLRGLDEAARKPWMVFHKSKVYYNTSLWRETLTKAALPFMRSLQVDWLPPAWREEALAEPMSTGAYLKLMIKENVFSGKRDMFRWRRSMKALIDDPIYNNPELLPPLHRLSEDEIMRLVERLIRRETEMCDATWFGWTQFARDIAVWMQLMLSWYDGEHPEVLGDVFAGAARQSKSQVETFELCAVAKTIADSSELRSLFNAHEGPAFFEACGDSEQGRELLKLYEAFRDKWAYRGHEDRDLYFPRRCEDPWIDYRMLRAMLSGDEVLDPEAREAAVNKRRIAAVEEITANLRRKSLGALRAECFRLVHDYFLEFLVIRDDERWSTDRTTMSQRLLLQEYGRRLKQRGLIERDDDCYFLTLHELRCLAAGCTASPLVRSKIAARRRDFERMHNLEITPPYWLQHGQGVELDIEAFDDSDPNNLSGLATSSGTVTGIARIVPNMKAIGTVRQGDILVCNSTDPGWTPVFSVVSAVVTETGGMLAHASCLSREYGLPAVQIAGAMKRIPDGATITVNGSTGRVHIDLIDAALEPAGA